MTITFSDTLKRWNDDSWHYVRVPHSNYEELKEIGQIGGRGLGAVKVEATVGDTTWQTSVFPDSKDQSHLLFIKKSVRSAEHLDVGSVLDVRLKIIAKL